MSETQYTHGNISKEEKENRIVKHLIEYGCYDPSMPPIEHQDANTMHDDIRFPKYKKTEDSKGIIERTISSSEILNKYDILEEVRNIPANNTMGMRYTTPIDIKESFDITSDNHHTDMNNRSGLCINIKPKITYSFTLIKNEKECVDIDVSEGSMYSILCWDSISFTVHCGKAIKYLIVDSGSVTAIVMDTGEPFKSNTEIIDVSTIIDIQDINYSYDISKYEKVISKCYTDWNLAFFKKVLVPGGDIEAKQPLPAIKGIRLEDYYLENIQVYFNSPFSISTPKGKIMFNKEQIIEAKLAVFSETPYMLYDVEGVLYNIPFETIGGDMYKKVIASVLIRSDMFILPKDTDGNTYILEFTHGFNIAIVNKLSSFLPHIDNDDIIIVHRAFNCKTNEDNSVWYITFDDRIHYKVPKWIMKFARSKEL